MGNHEPVDLMAFIKTTEETLNQDSKKQFLPTQAGDVIATYADIQDLK